VHFDRPVVAMESYREANALRASRHEFFPQAVLHLARAHNQQMYISRDTDAFAEASIGLQQLIDHKHYGAYPYYLLSISHRLVAETYDAEPVEGDSDLTPSYFNQALEWARKGQVVDPTDDRPVTAEAECLESMGRFEEAIAARTRAISLADSDHKRWEGHHYRWRLYYWTDQLDAALADLEACEVWSPDSRLYAHVYPALVYAEAGDMEQALWEARVLAETDPTDAQAVLWSATSLRLLGRLEEADELLGIQAAHVDFANGLVHPQNEEWVEALYAFCLGEISFDDLMADAEGVTSHRKLRAEAHFHAAARAFGAGDRAEALRHLEAAYRSFDEELGYTFHAKTIREKMRNDSTWPLWIPDFSVDHSVGARGPHRDKRPLTQRSAQEGEDE
jgi:tetratricopeptide (TPR) repeat protein